MTGKIVKGEYYIDGEEVSKSEFYRVFKPAVSSGGKAGDSLVGFKPLVSTALAVHPKQVREAIEDAKAKGVPTEFRGDGRPVFTSREHRKNYCRQYGFYDKDAGYGDAAPGSCKRDIPDQPDPRKLYDL